MATNPIAKGTCNVSINITTLERDVLGRIANQGHPSIGELIKGAYLMGLRQSHAEAAEAIEKIRVRWKEKKSADRFARATPRAYSAVPPTSGGSSAAASRKSGTKRSPRIPRAGQKG